MFIFFCNTYKFEMMMMMTKYLHTLHLHLCCTTNQHFTTTNAINRDEATIQASRNTASIGCRYALYRTVTFPMTLTDP